MFKSFFAGEKNLYDVGESGIDLGLPHVNMDCHVAAAPRNDEACEAEDRGNPHAKDIETFLQNERKALEELRELLTGKTDLKGEKLLEKIKNIAEPREYLYLHFPDGYKLTLEQSFLNRIRTEIDFFLKTI